MTTKKGKRKVAKKAVKQFLCDEKEHERIYRKSFGKGVKFAVGLLEELLKSTTTLAENRKRLKRGAGK